MIIIISVFWSTLSAAQTTVTSDDLELRARNVGHALRCVVCQNQSIEESEASLAKDMRLIVRERMSAGETDAQVIEFMRERYGDYVLLKPPFQPNTYLLWIFPAVLVFSMGLWFLIIARKRKLDVFVVEPLSDEEKVVLKNLMDTET